MRMRFLSTDYPSPFGKLTCYAGQKGLAAIYLEGQEPPLELGLSTPITLEHTATPARQALEAAKVHFAEYFAGKRTRFDLPLDPSGTYYERKVWKSISAIAPGQYKRESDILKEIPMTDAALAVSHAVERCPLPFVIPTHMVRTSNPRKTIFSHGRALASTLRAGETFVEAIRTLQQKYQVQAAPADRASVCDSRPVEELLFALGVKKSTVRTKFSTLLAYLDLSEEEWGQAKSLVEHYFADYARNLGAGPLAHLGVTIAPRS